MVQVELISPRLLRQHNIIVFNTVHKHSFNSVIILTLSCHSNVGVAFSCLVAVR